MKGFMKTLTIVFFIVSLTGCAAQGNLESKTEIRNDSELRQEEQIPAKKEVANPELNSDEVLTVLNSNIKKGVSSTELNLNEALSDLTSQIVNSMTEGAKKKVAVIEFSDLRGNVSEFGKYLAEELITRLFVTRKFEVIERRLLNKVLSEQKLSLSDLIDPDSIVDLGKILGVDAIVSGTITDLGKSLKVNARIISTETGSVFAVAAAEIKKDETVRNLMSQVGVVQKPKEKVTEEVEERPVEKPVERFREGLRAEYFNLPPFTDNPGALHDEPTFERRELQIYFPERKSPAPGISADYFGTRYTGMVYIPATGTYLFRLHHWDGARMFISDKLLIEHWHSGPRHDDKEIFLKGNKWYPIRVEFFKERGRGGVIRLEWRPPGSNELKVVSSSNFRTKEFK